MDGSFLAVWGPGSRPYALRCGPQLDHILYIVQMEGFNVLADRDCNGKMLVPPHRDKSREFSSWNLSASHQTDIDNP